MYNRLPDEGEKKLHEQEKEIRKKYELEDDKRTNALKYIKAAEREQRKKDFTVFVERKREWFRGFAEKREKILGFR